MRRLLIIFMLMVVPFQLSWGQAAAYCKHETNPAVSHFGHHVHQHTAGGEASKAATLKVQLGDDSDCATCVLAGVGIAPSSEFSLPAGESTAIAQSEASPLLASWRARPPERPQWHRVGS
ncbi:cation efflux protein, CzcI family [Noviherbaspirillum galbum]|uniref:Cobalt-zinc-cadmium resistance protein n=1 Tax=Noviherbaspirillum galbum TaxID=2709383 RepID=A0A6B3SYT7_9BURK|nr:cation efflux protein, CzcI family [Noviherbaspirillum galbum]NEX63319.1 cobalt-zinc-cadmium resistance protein [Noviherbaspirillum galbum]